MPSIPDVGILHCGELPHHKMGIKVGPGIVGVRNHHLCVPVKYIQKCGGWDPLQQTLTKTSSRATTDPMTRSDGPNSLHVKIV